MRQLQLFTTAEVAGMRDRTASRRYSPGREAFRRDHERQRAWGLQRRHAERLHRSRAAAPQAPPVSKSHPQRPGSTRHSARPAMPPNRLAVDRPRSSVASDPRRHPVPVTARFCWSARSLPAEPTRHIPWAEPRTSSPADQPDVLRSIGEASFSGLAMSGWRGGPSRDFRWRFARGRPGRLLRPRWAKSGLAR